MFSLGEHHVTEISVLKSLATLACPCHVILLQDPGVDEWEAGQLARAHARWH